MLNALRTAGTGLVAASPLEGGLLGGVLRKERDGKRRLEGLHWKLITSEHLVKLVGKSTLFLFWDRESLSKLQHRF